MIVVLFGGKTKEREGSFKSACDVSDSLSRTNIKHIMLEFFSSKIFDILPSNALIFNVVLGAGGEDGEVSNLCAERDIKYNYSHSDAHEKAFDKIAFHKELEKMAISAPKYYIDISDVINKDISYLIKPTIGGESMGIIGPFKFEELRNEYQNLDPQFSPYYIEEFIQGTFATQMVNDFYDENEASELLEVDYPGVFYSHDVKMDRSIQNYIYPGRFETKAHKKTKDISLKIYNELNFKGVVSFDYMVQGNNVYVLEANTIPDITIKSNLAAIWNGMGRSYDDLIYELYKQL